MNAELQECLDTVLRRLRLNLTGGCNVGNQRDVDGHCVRWTKPVHELPHGLQEGKALDVADSPPNLRDDDIVISRLSEGFEPPLDFVRNVGDHLHRGAEIIAAPFLGDHLEINLSCGGIVPSCRGDVQKPFVVSKVEIGLCPVIGHVHFPVLERVHRAGIDIEVWVELLDRHAQPA